MSARRPYAWSSEHPRCRIARTALLDEVDSHLQVGDAVKVIGGRGMGKSVLLHDVETRLHAQEGTRVVLVPGPPEARTVIGAVNDLVDCSISLST